MAKSLKHRFKIARAQEDITQAQWVKRHGFDYNAFSQQSCDFKNMPADVEQAVLDYIEQQERAREKGA